MPRDLVLLQRKAQQCMGWLRDRHGIPIAGRHRLGRFRRLVGYGCHEREAGPLQDAKPIKLMTFGCDFGGPSFHMDTCVEKINTRIPLRRISQRKAFLKMPHFRFKNRLFEPIFHDFQA